jgi:WhiB family redox-sensing transcriptional regulator
MDTDTTGTGNQESQLSDDQFEAKRYYLPHLLDPSSDWEWRADAACRRHPELDFFAYPDSRMSLRCKTVCDTCIVKANCLDFSSRNNEIHGVWGGLEAPERRKS